MTEWFEIKPEDSMREFTVQAPGGGVMTFTRSHPDWVRLPPELGGGAVRVLRPRFAPCPACKSMGDGLYLEDGFVLHRCREGCEFVWCQLKERG